MAKIKTLFPYAMSASDFIIKNLNYYFLAKKKNSPQIKKTIHSIYPITPYCLNPCKNLNISLKKQKYMRNDAKFNETR